MLKKLCFGATLLVFAFSLFSAALSQEDPNEAEIKKLFRQGIEEYRKGNLEKAYELLETSLRKNPAPDLLRFLNEEVGNVTLLKLLAEEGQLKDTARRFLEQSKGEGRKIEETPEKIQALVAKLDSQDILVIHQMINRMILIGEPIVPFLVAELANEKNETLRTNAILALNKIGPDSTMPLVESLKSTNLLLRKNALVILATIRDNRSVPAIKTLLENPSEPEVIRKLASEALTKITLKSPSDLPTAKELFVEHARNYYRSQPTLMKYFFIRNYIWKWSASEDKLSGTEIPSFCLNEKLAEEACFNALASDPSFDAPWPILINAYLSELNEVRLAMENARIKLATEDVPEDQKKAFERLELYYKQLQETTISILTVDKKHLYAALDMAIDDDEPLIAVACIESLKNFAVAEDLPMPVAQYKDIFNSVNANEEPLTGYEQVKKLGSPLIKALLDVDKRVRYAAAETLVAIKPKEKFLYSDEVINALSQALEEVGIRTVLVATEITDTRNYLKKELRTLNCHPIEATNVTEAIIKAKQFPVCDLIIISFDLAQQVVFTSAQKSADSKEKIELSVIDSLREDIRTKNIPIFVLCAPESLTVAESIYGKNVNTYLSAPVDRKTLQDELNKVFISNEEDARNKANLVSLKAAETLASIDPDTSIYPYIYAYTSLVKALENRPDTVRSHVVLALGKYALVQAIEPLTKLLNEENISKELKYSCCAALRNILKNNKVTINDETYKSVKNAYLSDDENVQKVAAEVLHYANVSPEKQFELLSIKRMLKID